MKIIKNIVKNIAATTVLSGLSLFVVVYDVFSTPYPVTTFPSYLRNSLVVRFTGCFTKWIWENINKLIWDDDIPGSEDDLCPRGQYGLFSGSDPSFSSNYVSCGWKTLNMINAIIMSFLDQQKDISMRGIPSDPVLCCCDPEKDPENCTGPNVSSSSLPIPLRCPPQFPKLGDCLKLKPEATNYKVTNYIQGNNPTDKIIRGYQAWSVTWVAAPSSSTAYWVGLLDQCIPLPLAGNICINLSLNDVCKGGTCGPVRGYNPSSYNPGYCIYPPTSGSSFIPCATDVYMSSTTDGWIIRYDPRDAFILTYFSESPNSCGMGWGVLPPPTYNGKRFTGNEGFLTLELRLGSPSNPVLIDIDAATPAADRTIFPSSSIPPAAIDVAPGKTDCVPETPYYEGDCYVRAYLQAIGMLKLKVGLTFYLEHRTYNWPHIQDIGIGIREINFSESPWLSLALQWRWFAKNCSNCARTKITEKAIQTFAFLDTIMRGLFRYSYIPSEAQKYFGPLALDISDMTQISTSHLFPTWVRPIVQDNLLIDIALGGDP
ncbi:MAG: hypothetical protein ACO2PO_20925, partial [Candidatus Calescibacterium sp.]